MIKINDEFSAKRDTFGWELQQTINSIGKTKKNLGQLVTTIKKTYHANFTQVCCAILDRNIGKKAVLEDIVLAINEFEKHIDLLGVK